MLTKYSNLSWDTALKSRNVADSIPDEVIGIFHGLNPSGRIMAVGSSILNKGILQGDHFEHRDRLI
jgi:hypothetical protein